MLTSSGRASTGRVNPLKSTKKILWRKIKNKDFSETEGTKESKMQRRKPASECLRCAWPPGDKGIHRLEDGICPNKLDKGMAKNGKLVRAEESMRDNTDSDESSEGSD